MTQRRARAASAHTPASAHTEARGMRDHPVVIMVAGCAKTAGMVTRCAKARAGSGAKGRHGPDQ